MCNYPHLHLQYVYIHIFQAQFSHVSFITGPLCTFLSWNQVMFTVRERILKARPVRDLGDRGNLLIVKVTIVILVVMAIITTIEIIIFTRNNDGCYYRDY